jgi:hypothetical protein
MACACLLVLVAHYFFNRNEARKIHKQKITKELHTTNSRQSSEANNPRQNHQHAARSLRGKKKVARDAKQ